MKFITKNKKYIAVTLAFLGLLTLFFFPEPESNFIYYLATALLFIMTILLITRAKDGE